MMDDLTQLLKLLGVTKGLFVLFFLGAHWVVLSQYRSRVRQMQAEIDRLATDNHLYRDRFLAFIDRQMNYKKPKSPKGGE